MPRFVVEKTMSARTECPEIGAPVEDREQVTAHQDSGLDIDERRPGMNIELVAELDDIRHRPKNLTQRRKGAKKRGISFFCRPPISGCIGHRNWSDRGGLWVAVGKYVC